MAQPPQSKAPVPIKGQVITPALLEASRARAEEERQRIHAEAHEKGKHEGLKIAGRYRDGALVCLGFVVGLMIGGLWVQSSFERGATTAAAVSNSTLQRIPFTAPPPSPSVTAAEDYQRNAAAAREGCSEAELRAGRRNCR